MKHIKRIKKTIQKYHLLEEGDAVIVAVSGGADSVFLLHALCELKEEYHLTLYAAHVNHGLRKTAGRDEQFVRTLCKDKGIACFFEHAEVKALARRKKISEEQAGREVRYSFFEKLRKTLPADKIATAHHKNDLAETVLMNLIRGSGITGLCGIMPKRGAVIRPLLNLSRKEIEQACMEEAILFVTDETNFETVYTRNKVRLSLLPQIKAFNPNFVETVARNADILREEADFLEMAAQQEFDVLAEKTLNGFQIPIDKLCKKHIAMQRRMIQKMTQGVSATQVEDILSLIQSGQTGKLVVLPDGWTARIEYGYLVVDRQREKSDRFYYPLQLSKLRYIPEADLSIYIERVDCPRKATKMTAYFSQEAIGNLAVKSRQNGDFFFPEGMEGKKKIKDYFIDQKISRAQRGRIPILVSGEEILWVIPYRRDRRYLKREGPCLKVTVWEGKYEGN